MVTESSLKRGYRLDHTEYGKATHVVSGNERTHIFSKQIMVIRYQTLKSLLYQLTTPYLLIQVRDSSSPSSRPWEGHGIVTSPRGPGCWVMDEGFDRPPQGISAASWLGPGSDLGRAECSVYRLGIIFCARVELSQKVFSFIECAGECVWSEVDKSYRMSTSQGQLQWFTSVQAAFPDDQELCQRIFAEASYEPTRLPNLFEDISLYILSLRSQSQHPSHDLPTNPKKRKIEDGSSMPAANGAPHQSRIGEPVVSLEVKDVSVQIPARKKLNVQFVADAKDRRRGEVRLINSAHELQHALPAENIDQVFCLPVPDKQQRQSHFAIIPKPGAVGAEGVPSEQILFTLNDTSPPSQTTSTEDSSTVNLDNYITATSHALTTLLGPYGKTLTTPSASEFASSRSQHHRKNEKGYHVNAYRGSKEGYLFFLDNGILFGFKKPLAFFPFSAVESISYTSVLQRTFNLVIAYHDSTSPETEAEPEIKEVEFSMLDQEDFAGIDSYVKRHGLNDASMAAERRAKAYNVNKPKGGEVNGEVGGGVEEHGELQKAEQQLQDEEDEEEEDYEASGGESDGEGEEQEDEDGEEQEEYDEEGAEEEEGEGVEYEDYET